MSRFSSSPLQNVHRNYCLLLGQSPGTLLTELGPPNSRLAPERARSSGAGSSQASASCLHCCCGGHLLLCAHKGCPLLMPASVVRSHLREMAGRGETLVLDQGSFCTLMGEKWLADRCFVVWECPLINRFSDRVGGGSGDCH